MDLNIISGTYFGQDYQQVGSSGARTTSFQVIGVEKLGNNMEAKFRIEVQPQIFAGDGNGFNTAAGTAGTFVGNGTAQTTGQASQQSGLAGKGYSFVGLAGDFGEVQFGTINSASLAAFGNASGRFGTGIGSGYGQILGSTSTNTYTRFESTALYMTPMINGFQGRYMQNFGNDSQWGATTGVTLRRPEIREFGASFAQGPISLAAAHLTSTTSPNEAAATATAAAGSNVKTTTMTLSAAYTAGPLRVAAGMSNIENNAGASTDGTSRKLETSAWMIAGQYQMGAIRLMANYGNRKTDASSVTSNVGEKSKFLGLAAEYDLSKRTYVYARMSDQDMKDAYASTLVVNGQQLTARTNFNPDVKVIGVGISHQF
jgi:predicted porin